MGSIADLKRSAGALEKFEETFLQLTGLSDEQDVTGVVEG